jgi:hypothetical protein
MPVLNSCDLWPRAESLFWILFSIGEAIFLYAITVSFVSFVFFRRGVGRPDRLSGMVLWRP